MREIELLLLINAQPKDWEIRQHHFVKKCFCSMQKVGEFIIKMNKEEKKAYNKKWYGKNKEKPEFKEKRKKYNKSKKMYFEPTTKNKEKICLVITNKKIIKEIKEQARREGYDFSLTTFIPMLICRGLKISETNACKK